MEDDYVCCVCEAPSTHAVTGLVSGTTFVLTKQYCSSCYYGRLEVNNIPSNLKDN